MRICHFEIMDSHKKLKISHHKKIHQLLMFVFHLNFGSKNFNYNVKIQITFYRVTKLSFLNLKKNRNRSKPMKNGKWNRAAKMLIELLLVYIYSPQCLQSIWKISYNYIWSYPAFCLSLEYLESFPNVNFKRPY